MVSVSVRRASIRRMEAIRIKHAPGFVDTDELLFLAAFYVKVCLMATNAFAFERVFVDMCLEHMHRLFCRLSTAYPCSSQFNRLFSVGACASVYN